MATSRFHGPRAKVIRLPYKRAPFAGAYETPGSSQANPGNAEKLVFGPISLGPTIARSPPFGVISQRARAKIEQYAKEKLAKNSELHGFAQAEKTARLAIYLADLNGADSEACWAAAMLRDVCRSEEGFSGRMGSQRAMELLKELELPESFVQKVGYAVTHSHNPNMPQQFFPKECAVLWEAVNIQNMGKEGFESRLLPLCMESAYSSREAPLNDETREQVDNEAYKNAVCAYLSIEPQFRTPLLKGAVKGFSAQMHREFEPRSNKL